MMKSRKTGKSWIPVMTMKSKLEIQKIKRMIFCQKEISHMVTNCFNSTTPLIRTIR